MIATARWITQQFDEIQEQNSEKPEEQSRLPDHLGSYKIPWEETKLNYSHLTRGLLMSSAAAISMAGQVVAEGFPQETSLSGLEYELIGREDIYTYGALESYSEAPFLTELVGTGALPPLADRLPAEPIIFKTGVMVDGVGEYGGVFRHVIGGRPEGWNWAAGQHQGWGGINMAIQECLVRQGPRWQIRGEDQSGPLPNLARSWTWNADATEVTMNLIEGAKWSDGDMFDTEDVRFWWEDNVQDANVTSRMAAGSFGGADTTMEVIDDFTFKFTFSSPQSETVLERLAYIQGCPGPSHVLKESHPTYNSDSTYEAYTGALPADELSPVVLGAWVPVVHRPDELVVLRRNPFYFKVDESGQQLPYFNEMHFRLSTWGDRTTQTVAGTGDFSNMEDPANFVEALKQSQSDDSPVRAAFGPRVLGWRMDLNYDVNTAEDEYGQALRAIFRETDFRLGLSHALDRDAIGQAVARGPFAHPYTGGFQTGSPYFDAANTAYQEFDQDIANALFDGLGLIDTDGNGVRNLPGGEDIVLDVQFKSSRNEDRKQLDAMASQLAEVGIRVQPRPIDETNFDTVEASGAFDAKFGRINFILPTFETCRSLPAGDACPIFNQSGDRMPFEQGIADAYEAFVSSDNPADKAEAAQTMQTLLTENAYSIGTVQFPAALLINKRIRNAHPGTPVFMYEWAEDAVIRERLWTTADQQEAELLPGTVAEY